MNILSLLLLAYPAPPSGVQDVEAADLVLTAGRIVTLNDEQPEVQALAIRDGRILALGDAQRVAAHVAPTTRVIDLDGRLAIPGFIEGHGHFLGLGDSKMQLDLAAADSWDEIVAMVAMAAREVAPGVLIRGRGWHQEKWNQLPEGAVEGLPLHDSLSAASPSNPVLLTHASGHALYANAKAMEMSGVDEHTPDPEGGQVLRDEEGQPTGAFRETAARLLDAAWARARRAPRETLAAYAAAECLSKGVTSFQDAGSSFRDLRALRELAHSGELPVRLWMMLREPVEQLREQLPHTQLVGFADNHLTLGGIKRSIDGALGSHGAWLLEPYSDLPQSSGLNTVSVEDVQACAALALEHGLQLCVHAIGDRANREVLDIYEQAFAEHAAARPGGAEDAPDNDLRWRIEHAQHLHPDDIPRFASLGVIASMQGVHCTSDGPWVPQRLGEQRSRSGAYVWRSLLDSGAVVTNGTDAPVENLDPIASFYASVTRRSADGNVFYSEQRMSRMEALRSYTLSNAYAAFEEHLKGSLEVGKLADVVVLSQDILKVPEEDILSTRVELTIVGGRVLFKADEGEGR